MAKYLGADGKWHIKVTVSSSPSTPENSEALNQHISSKVIDENGVHGLRVDSNTSTISYHNGVNWIEIPKSTTVVQPDGESSSLDLSSYVQRSELSAYATQSSLDTVSTDVNTIKSDYLKAESLNEPSVNKLYLNDKQIYTLDGKVYIDDKQVAYIDDIPTVDGDNVEVNLDNYYTKAEVYAKTETYGKDEVYAKNEVYPKTEAASINDLENEIAKLTNGTTVVGEASTASTANKLTTSVNINGVAFDGSSDITITSSDSTKLPLTGGTVSGNLVVNNGGASTDYTTAKTRNIILQTSTPSSVTNGAIVGVYE